MADSQQDSDMRAVRSNDLSKQEQARAELIMTVQEMVQQQTKELEARLEKLEVTNGLRKA